MKHAITFVNNRQTSIVTSLEELIKEINHYQCFWLDSASSKYSSIGGVVRVVVEGLSNEDRKWLAERVSGEDLVMEES